VQSIAISIDPPLLDGNMAIAIAEMTVTVQTDDGRVVVPD
jgi:hypothetical protein